ncbi:Voltage-gated potassium channel Kch [Corynebacterium ciconiae DSM 44920]|nr:Voltage-gated potassium channel Kch [Corynebacterium ciconiae DSM 44920]
MARMRNRFGTRARARQPVVRRPTELDDLPDYALLNIIRIPQERRSSPWLLIARRVVYAIVLILTVTVIVYFDSGGYTEPLSFLDALYYSVVSLSTTGYGDIAPVTDRARLLNVIVVTPLRIAFLILLVGTTLAVLTEESRRTLQIQRWRKRLRNHTVVIGYGTKGRSAVTALLADGVPPGQIVVVDTNRQALERASGHNLVTVQGNATKSDVLKLAGVSRARAVVVAPNQDDTAVLITLSVREIAPSAMIVASVRESENLHLVEQSGADSVVISSETAGRMLGLATVTPPVVEMMEDLLSPGEGFSIAERMVKEDEVGANPRHLADIVLGVVRSGKLYRIDAQEAESVEPGDRLLYVRRVLSADIAEAESSRGEST